MKLRTSYFNSAVLKKDITRFAPVWGLYTLFMLMVVFLLNESHSSPERFANSAAEIMLPMGIVNFVYAGICGLLLFGDLFNTRMCNMLHAFPMRREGWFLTHCASGMLFCLIPNLLGTLMAAVMLQRYAYMALLWLGLMLLQYLFFFGAAAFSAMCAGNRLGAAAMYGILNFLAVLVTWLVMTFYEPFLFGIELDMGKYADLSPVVAFSHGNYVSTTYGKIEGFCFEGFYAADWIYLFVSAGVGVVLLILAMLIYRARKLESAGDFVSLEPVGLVFLIIYTLCAGAVMYYAADLIAESARYVFLLIGFGIGFFTGRMLLEKKVNVFRGKNLLAFGAMLAMLGITVGLTWLDPLGITRYIPSAGQVAGVTIGPAQHYTMSATYELTQPEDIQAMTQIHKQLLNSRKSYGDIEQCLRYQMKDGTILERKYYMDADSTEAQILKGYYSRWQCVLRTEDVDELLNTAHSIEFYSYREDIPNVAIFTDTYGTSISEWEEKYGNENVVAFLVETMGKDSAVKGLNTEPAKGLIVAIQKDCAEQKMAQVRAYHYDHETSGYLLIQCYTPTPDGYGKYKTVEIDVCGNCTNTVRYLQGLKTAGENNALMGDIQITAG